MTKRHLGFHEIQMIYNLHEKGVPQKEIAEKVGCGISTVCRYAGKYKASHSCPNCHHALPPVSDMVFCPFCASDIRSPGAKAAAKLHDVLRNISNFYPANLRDDAIAAINNAIEILEEA